VVLRHGPALGAVPARQQSFYRISRLRPAAAGDNRWSGVALTRLVRHDALMAGR